ncbi:hypothetical protein EYF80_018335 [Liparis tanakae]|uniref:Uncharacterized protein n=1 Tax=Liparis tanakae TaxID=230148 RepID=A0A4Z2I028_9TELE|nr:hypothetical protein EYF80_018335 [Liparis tanakae]
MKTLFFRTSISFSIELTASKMRALASQRTNTDTSYLLSICRLLVVKNCLGDNQETQGTLRSIPGTAGRRYVALSCTSAVPRQKNRAGAKTTDVKRFKEICEECSTPSTAATETVLTPGSAAESQTAIVLGGSHLRITLSSRYPDEDVDVYVGGVFGDVRRYAGQFEVGAVDHGAFTATFLRTHQILETIATQTTAVVLLTCGGKRERERPRGRGSDTASEKQGGKTDNRIDRREKGVTGFTGVTGVHVRPDQILTDEKQVGRSVGVNVNRDGPVARGATVPPNNLSYPLHTRRPVKVS